LVGGCLRSSGPTLWCVPQPSFSPACAAKLHSVLHAGSHAL
jgi:hypothetical protein